MRRGCGEEEAEECEGVEAESPEGEVVEKGEDYLHEADDGDARGAAEGEDARAQWRSRRPARRETFISARAARASARLRSLRR